MLSQTTSPRQAAKSPRGFTIVELLAALAVLAILAAIAAPAMTEWIHKARVRAGVEDLQNGLRHAQAEAAKRNAIVEFALTKTVPLPNNDSNNNDTAVDNGEYWVARVIQPNSTDKIFLQGGDFGSHGIKIVGDNNKSLFFNGIGRVLDRHNPDRYLADTRVYRVVSKTDQYPICVLVRSGGGIRWCDPAAGSTSPMACPADISCPKS